MDPNRARDASSPLSVDPKWFANGEQAPVHTTAIRTEIASLAPIAGGSLPSQNSMREGSAALRYVNESRSHYSGNAQLSPVLESPRTAPDSHRSSVISNLTRDTEDDATKPILHAESDSVPQRHPREHKFNINKTISSARKRIYKLFRHESSPRASAPAVPSDAAAAEQGNSDKKASSGRSHWNAVTGKIGAAMMFSRIRSANRQGTMNSVYSYNSVLSDISTRDLQWSSEAQQADILKQQTFIDSDPMLSFYCRCFEVALHGYWAGGDIFHPSQKGVERPEIAAPGIAGLLSSGTESAVGKIVEKVTLNLADQVIEAIPGGAGKLVEQLVTIHHQRKNNNLNLKFSESIKPTERLRYGNTTARACTESRAEKIKDIIAKEVDTTRFLKWVDATFKDLSAFYLDGTKCEHESAAMTRTRALAFHDATEFVMGTINPKESGMFDKIPNEIRSLDEVLPFQLEWLDRQLSKDNKLAAPRAEASSSPDSHPSAFSAEHYKKFVKPGIAGVPEFVRLKDEPIMKRMVKHEKSLTHHVQKLEKQIMRLQFDRLADQAEKRTLLQRLSRLEDRSEISRGTAASSFLATGGKYYRQADPLSAGQDVFPLHDEDMSGDAPFIRAMNVFLDGKAPTSPEHFKQVMEQHGRWGSRWTCEHIVRYVQNRPKLSAQQVAMHLFAANLRLPEVDAALAQLKSQDPDNAFYTQIKRELHSLHEKPSDVLPESIDFKECMATLKIDEPEKTSVSFEDIAFYLEKSHEIKARYVSMDLFTANAQRNVLAEALHAIMDRDLEVHPENKDEYQLLENSLLAILQRAIDKDIDYQTAKSECLNKVETLFGLGPHHGSPRFSRFMQAVKEAFHKIVENIEHREDVLYALNGFVRGKAIPVCREFVIRLRHHDKRESEPHCFHCDRNTGQWYLAGAPEEEGRRRAVVPRDYINELLHDPEVRQPLRGIEILVADNPSFPIVKLLRQASL